MDAGKRNTEGLAEKDARYVWHAMSRLNPGSRQTSPPMMVAEGSGAWISDTEGNRYLDGMSGLWCVNVGYGREELARAAYEQLAEAALLPAHHGPRARGGARREAERVARRRVRLLLLQLRLRGQRGGLQGRPPVPRAERRAGPVEVRLAATGPTTATPSGRSRPRARPSASTATSRWPPGFLHVAPPDRYRCAYCSDRPACNHGVRRAIGRTIEWELPETVAGVIMEPIITGGGIFVPPEGYVEKVAEICERTGVLFIVDEVICGFGRTGRRFGHQHYGVKPDIVTMAKGITSAYLPLSATAVRREVFEALQGDRGVRPLPPRQHLRRQPGGVRPGGEEPPDHGRRGPARALRPDGRAPAAANSRSSKTIRTSGRSGTRASSSG